MRIKTIGYLTAAAIAACLAALPASANGGKKSMAAPGAKPVVATQTCTGGFSNGRKVSVNSPVNMLDIGFSAADKTYISAPNQSDCDVYTFAWNQFLYVTQESADPNNGGMKTPLQYEWPSVKNYR